MDLLSSLNPQQAEAVQATEGPLLILAGAGSGKTRVITVRIAHLLAQGVPPNAICAVTFTNKAAEEIAVRLKRTLGDRADDVTRGTLHALCLGILRAHADAAGLPSGFGVADKGFRCRMGRDPQPARRN